MFWWLNSWEWQSFYESDLGEGEGGVGGKKKGGREDKLAAPRVHVKKNMASPERTCQPPVNVILQQLSP